MRLLIAAILILFLAPNSNGQDYSKIAPEYCECYQRLEDSIYVEYIPYVIAASREPQFAMAYFSAISPKGKDFASIGMKSWSHLKKIMVDPKNDMGKCAAALDLKYFEHLTDDSKRRAFNLGILEELERTGQCGFYAAMLRSVYRQADNGY